MAHRVRPQPARGVSELLLRRLHDASGRIRHSRAVAAGAEPLVVVTDEAAKREKHDVDGTASVATRVASVH